MNVRTRRLRADYEQIKEGLRTHPAIHIRAASGTPPEVYQIDYTVRSLAEGADGRIGERLEHVVEIYLTLGYPRQAPQCRMLTPVFHPNVAPHAICIGDHWAAGESLLNLIVRIGEILAYQSYNTKSPLNGAAARWVEENVALVPTDTRDLSPRAWSGAQREAAAAGQCQNCRAAGKDLQRCSQGHEVCPDCLVACPRCGKTFCLLCKLVSCPVCGGLVCETCRSKCIHCGRTVCTTHLLKCALCDQTGCPDCVIECQECGRRACLTHARQCSVCRKMLCTEHAAVCAGCGKALCKEHASTCTVCSEVRGQRSEVGGRMVGTTPLTSDLSPLTSFCPDCLFQCHTCGAQVCVEHVAQCATCRTVLCPTHRLTCSKCGRTFCAAHFDAEARMCPACGAPAISPWTVDAPKSDSPAPLLFPCLTCQVELRVAAQHSGKRVRCPKCGTVSTAP